MCHEEDSGIRSLIKCFSSTCEALESVPSFTGNGTDPSTFLRNIKEKKMQCSAEKVFSHTCPELPWNQTSPVYLVLH